MATSEAPQLQLSLSNSTTTFKRSFEQFGFDLESPVDSTSAAGPSDHVGVSNGERSKRQRSNLASPDTSSFSDSIASSSSSQDVPVASTSSSERPPTPIADITPQSDEEMLDPSPIPAPLDDFLPAAEFNEQFRLSMERFNAFDTQISNLRPGRASPPNRAPVSPPPTLPPLSLPSPVIEPVHMATLPPMDTLRPPSPDSPREVPHRLREPDSGRSENDSLPALSPVSDWPSSHDELPRDIGLRLHAHPHSPSPEASSFEEDSTWLDRSNFASRWSQPDVGDARHISRRELMERRLLDGRRTSFTTFEGDVVRPPTQTNEELYETMRSRRAQRRRARANASLANSAPHSNSSNAPMLEDFYRGDSLGAAEVQNPSQLLFWDTDLSDNDDFHIPSIPRLRPVEGRRHADRPSSTAATSSTSEVNGDTNPRRSSTAQSHSLRLRGMREDRRTPSSYTFSPFEMSRDAAPSDSDNHRHRPTSVSNRRPLPTWESFMGGSHDEDDSPTEPAPPRTRLFPSQSNSLVAETSAEQRRSMARSELLSGLAHDRQFAPRNSSSTAVEQQSTTQSSASARRRRSMSSLFQHDEAEIHYPSIPPDVFSRQEEYFDFRSDDLFDDSYVPRPVPGHLSRRAALESWAPMRGRSRAVGSGSREGPEVPFSSQAAALFASRSTSPTTETSGPMHRDADDRVHSPPPPMSWRGTPPYPSLSDAEMRRRAQMRASMPSPELFSVSPPPTQDRADVSHPGTATQSTTTRDSTSSGRGFDASAYERLFEPSPPLPQERPAPSRGSAAAPPGFVPHFSEFDRLFEATTSPVPDQQNAPDSQSTSTHVAPRRDYPWHVGGAPISERLFALPSFSPLPLASSNRPTHESRRATGIAQRSIPSHSSWDDMDTSFPSSSLRSRSIWSGQPETQRRAGADPTASSTAFSRRASHAARLDQLFAPSPPPTAERPVPPPEAPSRQASSVFPARDTSSAVRNIDLNAYHHGPFRASLARLVEIDRLRSRISQLESLDDDEELPPSPPPPSLPPFRFDDEPLLNRRPTAQDQRTEASRANTATESISSARAQSRNRINHPELLQEHSPNSDTSFFRYRPRPPLSRSPLASSTHVAPPPGATAASESRERRQVHSLLSLQNRWDAARHDDDSSSSPEGRPEGGFAHAVAVLRADGLSGERQRLLIDRYQNERMSERRLRALRHPVNPSTAIDSSPEPLPRRASSMSRYRSEVAARAARDGTGRLTERQQRAIQHMHLHRGARLGRNVGDFVRDEDFDASYDSLLSLAATLGDVRPRYTPDHVIASLPSGVHKDWANDDSDPRCPICLDDYQETDPVLKLSCSHWLHKGCLEQWLKGATTCPVCRAQVRTQHRSDHGLPRFLQGGAPSAPTASVNQAPASPSASQSTPSQPTTSNAERDDEDGDDDAVDMALFRW